MMQAKWQQDIRLELMREARLEQRICVRCSRPLDDADDAICAQCQYDDWHEEVPEIFPEVESE